jgi:hypothetical protein
MPLSKHLLRSVEKTIESIEETLDFLLAKALERRAIFLNKLKAIFYNLCSPIALLVSVYHLLLPL